MSQLWSFDGTECASGHIAKPERYEQLWSLLRNTDKVIGRGSALSYCNAAAGDEVVSVSTESFNRVLEFEFSTGQITVEAGVTVGQLLDVALDRGWFPPVLPGHPSITIGGCIGFNVHGKSQFHSGNFESCVLSLELFHPDHGLTTCDRDTNPELFRMTLGGFGLTGFITSATLQLAPLKGKSLRRLSTPAKNLEDAVAIMEEQEATTDAVYSWNNLSLRGASFGAGIVYSEEFADEALPSYGSYRPLSPESRRNVRFSCLNRVTIPVMHVVYSTGEKLKKSEIQVPIQVGAFPINGKEIYYKLFGRKGFREYQSLVPRDTWSNFADRVEKTIRSHGVTPTLGSLKLFRGEQDLLKFNGDGVCLTIDIVSDDRATEFAASLDQAVIDNGGIANLSKDSRIPREIVHEMYLGYDEFRDFINGYDIQGRLGSSLRRRILA